MSSGFRARTGRTVAFVRRVGRTTSDQNVTFLAAGVAYYAFASILPTVALVFIVATAFGGDQLAALAISTIGELLTDAGRQFIREATESGAISGGTTIFSILLAVWGSLKVFRAIDTAFETIYGATGSASFLSQFRDSLVVLVSIGASLLLMFGLGSVLAAVNLDFIVGLLSILVLPVVLAAAFLPMYYVFPEPSVSIREVLPGAVFAGVGWTVLQAVFQVYVELQGTGGGDSIEVYSIITVVLLLVTWLYLGGLLVLVGVVVNVTLADNREPGFCSSIGGARRAAVGDGMGPDHRVDWPGNRGTRNDNRVDRHGKGDAARRQSYMSGEEDDESERDDDEPAPDIARLSRRVAALQADLDDIDNRTVEKPALESELKRYVRARMRHGHARGWGPYLVLLYGVVLTLGAFYWLKGWVAIVAMCILFLSTLGLYTLFVIVGMGLNLLDTPGKAIDAVREWR